MESGYKYRKTKLIERASILVMIWLILGVDDLDRVHCAVNMQDFKWISVETELPTRVYGDYNRQKCLWSCVLR